MLTACGSSVQAHPPLLRDKVNLALMHDGRILLPIATVYRLPRDMAFLSGMLAHRVPFIVAELHAMRTPFMLRSAARALRYSGRDAPPDPVPPAVPISAASHPVQPIFAAIEQVVSHCEL